MGIAALNALSAISSYTCGFFFTELSPPGLVCVTLEAAAEVVEVEELSVRFSFVDLRLGGRS